MTLPCPLCQDDGGLLLQRTPLWRLVRVTDTPAHPAFYRVIVNRHVAEMSELPRPERHALMDAVNAVERVLRDALPDAKINLASLGNMVPHLHWHVLARFADDAHFPAPIWGAPQRDTAPARLLTLHALLPHLDTAVVNAVATAIADATAQTVATLAPASTDRTPP